MGMQCTFSLAELREGQETGQYKLTDHEDQVNAILPNHQGTLFFGVIADERDGEDHSWCWFDCGRLDATRIAMFRFLIENRISFTCA